MQLSAISFYFFQYTAIDYKLTRGSNPVENTMFKIFQVAGSKKVLPESTSTMTQGAVTKTESTNSTESCDYDIVCICLDASESMVVSIVDVVCNFR